MRDVLKSIAGVAVISAAVLAAVLLLIIARDQRAVLKELQAIKTVLEARPGGTPAPRTGAPAQRPRDDGFPADLTLDVDPGAVKGRPDAKLTVVEFSDFECPFCGRHARETFAQIERDYIATGKIRYAFRHYPLERIHPRALKAAEAAECARQQGRFWELHDRLFTSQRALTEPDLIAAAKAIGLPTPAFEECLNGRATSKVRRDMAVGSRAGVTGTPAFFLGVAQKDGSVRVLKKLTGAQPFTSFKLAIDGLLSSPALVQPAGGTV
jgi:protein-disulfide isomerase